uniref:Signal recognition particle 19 kDa protein n=1 Tax=Naja naja TaxID=35670 RepID=A0A8C6VQX8_NAJNA
MSIFYITIVLSRNNRTVFLFTIENPTSAEIQDVSAAVGLIVLLKKNKMYSRKWNHDAQYRGRVRIQLKQEDGNLCRPQFPTCKGSIDPNLQQEGGKKNKGKKKK